RAWRVAPTGRLSSQLPSAASRGPDSRIAGRRGRGAVGLRARCGEEEESMKLATFRPREAPSVQFGALLSDGRLLALRAGALVLLGEYALPERYDASRLLRHAVAFLESGSEAFSLAYQVMGRAEQALREGQALRGEPGQRLVYAVDSVEFLPPVPRAGKVLAAGRNFAEHAAEGGGAGPSEAPAE